MILPVFLYGHPVLKKVGTPITSEYPDLSGLINNMFETMYNAKGVGLAAPQIGLSIRLFIVDSIQIAKKGEEEKGIKRVFINPVILNESGDDWTYEEGCLSIPAISGDVERKAKVFLKFMDENFVEHTEEFDGFNARVIQHEYDHIEGKLFIEKLKPLKKKLIQGKLNKIKAGDVNADYKVKVYRL
jgi:peptide deformylase